MRIFIFFVCIAVFVALVAFLTLVVRSVPIIVIVGVVGVVAAVVIGFKRSAKTPAIIKMIAPMGLAMVFVVAYVILVALIYENFQLASQVDASPIAHVTEAQMELLEDVILQLEYDPAFSRGPGEWGQRRHGQAIYGLRWVGDSQFRRLTIRVAIHDNEADAIENMGQKGTQRWLRQGYRSKVFDNNTEAILEHCISNYSFPAGANRADRFFRSYVRIGNVIFSFSEARSRQDLDNNYTSQFIALFVELLEEAELAQNNE